MSLIKLKKHPHFYFCESSQKGMLDSQMLDMYWLIQLCSFSNY